MAVKPHSGKLTHARVKFKQPTSSLNDEGGIERTYAESFEMAADKDEYKDFRTTDATGTSLIGAFNFYVRWCNNSNSVDKNWLIEESGIDWTIHGIDKTRYRKEWIVFTAKTKQ